MKRKIQKTLLISTCHSMTSQDTITIQLQSAGSVSSGFSSWNPWSVAIVLESMNKEFLPSLPTSRKILYNQITFSFFFSLFVLFSKIYDIFQHKKLSQIKRGFNS